MKLQPAERGDRASIKKIYSLAFPTEERAPFFFIWRKAQNKKAELLSIRENDDVIGFAYLVIHEDLVYLLFLAIADEERGKGRGSWILQELLKRYQGKRIFLAREQLDETADNYHERARRREFYIRNGFHDMDCQIREGKVTYDVMGTGGRVTSEEYDDLIRGWCGRLIKRFVRMRFIEDRP